MGEMISAPRLELLSALDQNLRRVELTETQHEILTRAYTAVGDWLASSSHPLLRSADIQPQGSVRLRTTVRPLGQDHFDVDLLCRLPNANPYIHDARCIYETVGERLAEHGTYKSMLSRKNRCWRVDYAEETRFHLDVTPAVENPACDQKGILVPDRELKQLVPSNPLRYAELFDAVSKLVPVFLELERADFGAALAKGTVEPLPDPMTPKDMLRRIVQLLKRHRDLYFQRKQGHPPISIIITTLAAESYGAGARGVYNSPWDFIEKVVIELPFYVRHGTNGFEVPNPSAPAENFAEKWNTDPRKALDFYTWHKALVSDLAEYRDQHGLDQRLPLLRDRLVGPEAGDWARQQVDGIRRSRSAGTLYRAPVVGGLATLGAGSKVRANTFFGGTR